MRVIFLFPHMVMHGGALHYMLHVIDGLQAQGHTVGVVTLRHDPQRFPVPPGVDVLTPDDAPITSDLAYWLLAPIWHRRLERLVMQWQPDAMVSQVFPSNWWGWFIRRRHPTLPHLFVIQEPSAFIHSDRWIAALRPMWKQALARLLRPVLRSMDLRRAAYTDYAVANSANTAKAAEAVYGFQSLPLAYPGVDFARFPVSRGPRREMLVTSGHLSGFKRIDFLLEVMSRLTTRRPDIRLNIVGDGPDADRLRALRSELGLDEHVTFHGRLSDEELVRIYGESRLYIHGAMHEPFGMSVVEALATGTPAAAHASGGPQEIIASDAIGVLIDSEDPDAWADAIDAYLSTHTDSPDLADKCRERAEFFSWDHAITQIAKGLDDITKVNPGKDAICAE